MNFCLNLWWVFFKEMFQLLIFYETILRFRLSGTEVEVAFFKKNTISAFTSLFFVIVLVLTAVPDGVSVCLITSWSTMASPAPASSRIKTCPSRLDGTDLSQVWSRQIKARCSFGSKRILLYCTRLHKVHKFVKNRIGWIRGQWRVLSKRESKGLPDLGFSLWGLFLFVWLIFA